MSKVKRVVLDFSRAKKRARYASMHDVSAVARRGDTIFLASGHPEGICLFKRGGKRGLLVVDDAPAESRLTKTTVEADVFPLE
mgnify:CR=1 FL=1